MKKLLLLPIFLLFFSLSNAQKKQTAEFIKGSLTLTDGSTTEGWIKENFKNDASIQFKTEESAKKIKYEGYRVKTLKIASQEYLCHKGDFFKIIANGKLTFMQKMSNASNKVMYSGNDAIGFYGTPGKKYDYYIFANNQLELLQKTNLSSFIQNELAGCTLAIEKANTINGNIAQLQEAVEIYNNYVKQNP